ncbi:hypothetical protein [Kutzneria sp. CA-103260]|uniref:hypothetical protein n=1 Tax=Kutzneria sp. CA-103260 TaxID=2802641 RepID=UPI001BABFC1D|nr:hypothetical protein [Kutzneria sp. CA-103260]QUQ67586.1 hypothetical protein JJ691_53210 [Kutzneria sp. CA-103260]
MRRDLAELVSRDYERMLDLAVAVMDSRNADRTRSRCGRRGTAASYRKLGTSDRLTTVLRAQRCGILPS